VRAVLKIVFLAALVLPPALVALAAWAWWPVLGHPRSFVGLALVALYGVAAYLLLRQLRHIGISGSPGSPGRGSPVQFLRNEALGALCVFLLAAAAVLWALRAVFAWVR
jgi:hypothetical protein